MKRVASASAGAIRVLERVLAERTDSTPTLTCLDGGLVGGQLLFA